MILGFSSRLGTDRGSRRKQSEIIKWDVYGRKGRSVGSKHTQHGPLSEQFLSEGFVSL